MRAFLGLTLGVALSCAVASAGAQPAATGKWGVDTTQMSTTIRPGDDFYRYVNAGWLKTAKIPAGFPAYNSFTSSTLQTETQLTALIDGLMAGEGGDDPPVRNIRALYRSYVDVARLNALGLKPVQSDLDAIAALKTHQDVARIMGRPDMPGVFGSGVLLDARDPHKYSFAVLQSGLGIPAAQYYLAEGEPYASIRSAYRDYVRDAFVRAKLPGAEANADAILALETEIARAHWSPTDLRDPVRKYHPMSSTELATYAPGFDWAAFFAAYGIGAPDLVVVQSDTAVQKISAIFARTPVNTWRAWMAFHLLDGWAPQLGEDWQKAHFAFFSTRLGGIAEQRPLKPRAVQFVSETYGEDLGRLYVARYFPPEDRAQLLTMIGYMRDAFRGRIEKLEWMDAPTRAQAIQKLDKIAVGIGYPDKWRDFTSVSFNPTELIGNSKRMGVYDRADELAMLKEPRRDWQWGFTPQTINAGYAPSHNNVIFPAAILQPVFYDAKADPAVTFGSTAAVIGHEISHAFDDQGSQTDADGALRNWWTKEARAEFERRGANLVAQYGEFSPLPGVKVNGALTLGENIGDLGGLTVAYDAYRRYVDEKQGGKAPVIDGLTGDQRFFLAWAQVWRMIITDDYARQLAIVDVHSPNAFRANGVVRNLDAWYAAFDVKPSDKLYLPPADRVRIW